MNTLPDTLTFAAPVLLYKLEDEQVECGLAVHFIVASSIDDAFTRLKIEQEQRGQYTVTAYAVTLGTQISIVHIP